MPRSARTRRVPHDASRLLVRRGRRGRLAEAARVFACVSALVRRHVGA